MPNRAKAQNLTLDVSGFYPFRLIERENGGWAIDVNLNGAEVESLRITTDKVDKTIGCSKCQQSSVPELISKFNRMQLCECREFLDRTRVGQEFQRCH